MRLPRRGAARDDRGAAVVELALVLPLLLFLVFGLVDFGRALNAQILLTQAARVGARLDSLNQPNVASQTQAAAQPLSSVSVSVTACPANPTSADNAVVVTSEQFSYITPIGPIATLFSSGGVGSPITLTGRGVMPCVR